MNDASIRFYEATEW